MIRVTTDRLLSAVVVVNWCVKYQWSLFTLSFSAANSQIILLHAPWANVSTQRQFVCLTQVISDYSALTRDETVMSPWTKVAPVGGEHNSNVTPTAETPSADRCCSQVDKQEWRWISAPPVSKRQILCRCLMLGKYTDSINTTANSAGS